MITPADALELMTIVAACHHRTAPRMDDRQAAIATAGIWAELFNEFRLEQHDLVAAVKKRALSHADAPEPAEIIAFARDIRRDRSERTGPTPAYEALCDSKTQPSARERLAAIVNDVADRKSIGDA